MITLRRQKIKEQQIVTRCYLLACSIRTPSLCVVSEVWLLSYSMAAFRISSSRTGGQPLCGSSEKGPNLNFWNWCLVVLSRTALSPNYSATWCGYGQSQLKFIKQTIPNELLFKPAYFFAVEWAITDMCAQCTHLRIRDHFLPQSLFYYDLYVSFKNIYIFLNAKFTELVFRRNHVIWWTCKIVHVFNYQIFKVRI